MYLNGHAHTLTQYTVDGTMPAITTGAGTRQCCLVWVREPCSKLTHTNIIHNHLLQAA